MHIFLYLADKWIKSSGGDEYPGEASRILD